MNRRVLFVAVLFAFLAQPSFGEDLSKHDQLRISVQKICPVSGEALGEHGDPIRSKVGEETVFLCCESCRDSEVNSAHMATIHANIAKAQAICPVMKKALPKKPASTILEGQLVYVCCPPCSKKIAAKPKEFLDQIDKLYADSLAAKAERNQ